MEDIIRRVIEKELKLIVQLGWVLGATAPAGARRRDLLQAPRPRRGPEPLSGATGASPALGLAGQAIQVGRDGRLLRAIPRAQPPVREITVVTGWLASVAPK